jgi:hypothetical protein
MRRTGRIAIPGAVLLAALAPAALAGSLAIVVRDGPALDAATAREFQRDAERGLRELLEDRDLRLVWRGRQPLAAGENFDRLIVLDFAGDCSLRMPGSAAGGGALGSTLVTDGRILPFVSIDCDRVKATLARAPGFRHSLVPAGVLALALSRVAIHEIDHVVTGRSHHDATGVFRAEYTVADLLAPRIRRVRGEAPPGAGLAVR